MISTGGNKMGRSFKLAQLAVAKALEGVHVYVYGEPFMRGYLERAMQLAQAPRSKWDGHVIRCGSGVIEWHREMPPHVHPYTGRLTGVLHRPAGYEVFADHHFLEQRYGWVIKQWSTVQPEAYKAVLEEGCFDAQPAPGPDIEHSFADTLRMIAKDCPKWEDWLEEKARDIERVLGKR